MIVSKSFCTAKLYASRAISTGLLSVPAAGKKGKKNEFSQQSYTHHARYVQGSYPFWLRGKKKEKKSFLTAKLYVSRSISTGLLSVPAAGEKKEEEISFQSKIIHITRDVYRALIRSSCGGKKGGKIHFSQQSYTHHARYPLGSCLFLLRA